MKSATHQQPTTFQSHPESVQVEEFSADELQPSRPLLPNQTAIGSRPPSAHGKKQLHKTQSEFPPNLALVRAISDENNQLQKQKSRLEGQMGKLKKISENLLGENKKLREVHRERTCDIPKLMGSLSLNSSESMADYGHECFLLKELNCAIFKQIKALDQQRALLSQQIESKKEGCMRLNDERVAVEQEYVGNVKARLAGLKTHHDPKDKYGDEDRVEKAEKDNESIGVQIHQLEAQINSVLVQNTELRSQIDRYRATGTKPEEIAEERANYLLSMVCQQSEIKQYQDELTKDKNAQEKAGRQLRQKEEKYAASVQALTAQVRQYQTAQTRQQQIVAQTASVRERLVASELAIETNRGQHESLASQKRELKEQIRAAKQRVRAFQATRSDKAGTLRAGTKENIKNLSNTAEKGRKTGEEQLKKIQEEKEGVDEKIKQIEVEHSGLEENAAEYTRVLQQYDNPRAEVERLEMLVRVKKVR